GDEPLELAHQLAASAQLELRVDAPLHGEQPPLLQPLRLGRRKRLVLEIRERASAPETERLAENGARLRRVARSGGRASLLEQRLEAVEIKLTRLDPNQVAGGPALDPPTTQRSPQAGDVIVERVRRARWRRFIPQPVDQPIARNGPVRVQQQHCQDSSL